MLADLRRRMVAADEDLGKALVVAQLDVEARLQLLDQIDLEQQGLGLGLGGDELHRPGQVDHVGDALGVEAALGVLDDPLLQRARLADVEHLAGLAHHPVDARRVGQPADLILDQGRALQGGRGLVGRHADDIGESGRDGMRRAIRGLWFDGGRPYSFTSPAWIWANRARSDLDIALTRRRANRGWRTRSGSKPSATRSILRYLKVPVVCDLGLQAQEHRPGEGGQARVRPPRRRRPGRSRRPTTSAAMPARPSRSPHARPRRRSPP